MFLALLNYLTGCRSITPEPVEGMNRRHFFLGLLTLGISHMAKIPRYKISRDEKIRFQDALVKALTRKDDMGISNLQKVADSLVRNAMLGKEASIAMIADRLDGKVGGDFGSDSPITFQAIQIRAVWPTLNGSINGSSNATKVIDAEIDDGETIN